MAAGKGGLPYRRLGSLRFQLALLVLLWHGLPHADLGAPWLAASAFGPLAVMVFFVLSGFIIVEAVLAYYAGRPGAFLANRVVRLWPPHLAALAVTALVLLAAETPPGTYALGNLAANALALFPTVPLTDPLLGAAPRLDLLPVVWALRAEFLFYFAVAALLLSARLLSRPAQRLLLPTVLAATLLASLLFHHFWALSPRLVFYAGIAPHFVLGASLALGLSGQLPRHVALPIAVAALLQGTAHALTFQIDDRDTLAWSQPVAWERIGGAALYLALLALAWRRFHRPVEGLAKARDRYLGDLSYPLYLLHWPALLLTALVWPVPHWSNLLVAIVFSLLLAGTLQLLLDPPLQAWRRRLRGRSLP